MENKQKPSIMDHLMAGLNRMIPFVVAGGILMALGFAFAGLDAMDYPAEGGGSLGQTLYLIGNTHAMGLMYIVISGYIAQSIGGKMAMMGGMVGGSIAAVNGSTFLGAILAGFLAGYVVKLLLLALVKLPESLNAIAEILLVPVLSAIIVGLASIYLIGIPVAWLMAALTGFLEGLQGGSLLLLCIIIAVMMVVDMGGPFLRVAYFFSIASVAANPGVPQPIMAACMVGTMTAPLGISLATFVQKKKFIDEEIRIGQTAWVLGAAMILEECIPFWARDPKRIIPSCTLGAAVGGAIVSFMNVGSSVVHGGLFILPIPGAIQNPLGYVLATVAGTLVTAAMLLLLKKPVTEEGVVGQAGNEGNGEVPIVETIG